MSQKREHLVETALDLFYQKGINSIGINEVLQVSGVAKRTLYSHFKSKEELVLAALERRHLRFINWLANNLEKTASDQEVILQLFQSLDDWFSGKEAELGIFRGCFFINTAAEFADKDSAIFQSCIHHKHQVKQLIKSKLSEQNKGLTDVIYLMQEGAITSAHMTNSGREVTQTCRDHLLAQLS